MGVLAVRTGPARFGPLADRCAAGEIGIHIDRTFPLAETAEALASSARAGPRQGHRRAPPALIAARGGDRRRVTVTVAS